jgi:hypothetical protein
MAAKYEDQFFTLAVKLGWHRALKETLHQLDLMPPFEREPFDRVNDVERAQLHEVLVASGWLG